MALTAAERKAKLGHGGVGKLARWAKRSTSHTSRVVRGERFDERVVRFAARKFGLPAPEAFPEYAEQLRMLEPVAGQQAHAG